MTDNTKPAAPEPAPARDTGAFLLAAGGFAAAFGAASCCALPVLLGSFGLGSAWFVTLAWVAPPQRIALLAIAIACLASGGVLLWRRRGVVACTPGAICGRSGMTALVTGVLSLGAVLVALGFLYA